MEESFEIPVIYKNAKLTFPAVLHRSGYYAGSVQPKLLLGWNNNRKYKNLGIMGSS